jgi:hypothetical protein
MVGPYPVPVRNVDGATRESRTKGKHTKSHGFELIGRIDPQKAHARSFHAAWFFDTLSRHLS